MYLKTDTIRTCISCNTEQPIENFLVRHKNQTTPGKHRVCRICRNEKAKLARETKPNLVSIKQKECDRCHQVKSADQFGRNALSRDGLFHQCKECRREAHRLYNNKILSDPDGYQKALIQARDWKRNNREKMRESLQRWSESHHGYFSARNRHVKGGDLTREQWGKILTYFDNRCAYCGVEGDMQIEHVIPISRGGQNTASNVVPACSQCNHKKYNHTPEEAGMTFIKVTKGWIDG